jgi:tetratricopeptide (TPR) repeat protein
MPKSKRSSFRRLSPAMITDPRQRGLHAFQAGRFTEAIMAWSPLAEHDVEGRTALAEAYFRRALSGPPLDPAVADLRRAIELAPDDPRYRYHLGRYLHRRGDLAAASTQYRAVLKRDSSWASAAKLLALATLEQNSRADLADLPGFTPALERFIEPTQALLRGGSVPPGDDSPVGRFWRGLGRVAAGDAAALDDLSDDRPLPAPTLTALRRYYRGLAAVRAGDTDTALKLWQRALEAGVIPVRLRENLAVLLLDQLTALCDAGDVSGAAALAQRSVGLPGSAAFDELRLLALDRGAYAAASAGDWPRAVELWEAARQVLGGSASLGSPRPLLHNLALAYERQEHWEEAAESWRGMLRTRPRRKATGRSPAEESTLSDQQWAWVRERIITCYKQAGRPDEAVAVFRQIIKEDPNDLDVRVQLADALLANEQERAAENEIGRILQIDPHHVDALLRHAAFLDVRMELPASEQIMRDLAARHPEREDLRRLAAQHFLQHGRQYAEWGQPAVAYRAFVEGERYDPENYLFPLNQARMQNGQRPHEEIRALIERAIALAGEQAEAYVKILETWVIADRIDEARALLERIDRDLKLEARAYADFGLMIIIRVTPPPPPVGLLGFLGTPAPAPAPPPADTPWTRLASELLDRAVGMRPADGALHKQIAGELMLPRADLALPYAEAAARLAPDEPEALILLGIVQGLNDQVRAAKTTLQRAAQLARKQGKSALAQEAQELRRVVGTPMFRTGIQMSLMSAGMGDLDDDFDLDDIEDFF